MTCCFTCNGAFGHPRAVIIDEGMWDKGIRGIDDEEIEWIVPLSSLDFGSATASDDAVNMRASHRDRLGRALAKQKHNGGVVREHLEAVLNPSICGDARAPRMGIAAEARAAPGHVGGRDQGVGSGQRRRSTRSSTGAG